MYSHSSLPVDASLVADLNHQINSPLAAIRNALYLVAIRCPDPETLQYLRLADAEVAAIARILQTARAEAEANRFVMARAASAGRPGGII